MQLGLLRPVMEGGDGGKVGPRMKVFHHGVDGEGKIR